MGLNDIYLENKGGGNQIWGKSYQNKNFVLFIIQFLVYGAQ